MYRACVFTTPPTSPSLFLRCEIDKLRRRHVWRPANQLRLTRTLATDDKLEREDRFVNMGVVLSNFANIIMITKGLDGNLLVLNWMRSSVYIITSMHN